MLAGSGLSITVREKSARRVGKTQSDEERRTEWEEMFLMMVVGTVLPPLQTGLLKRSLRLKVSAAKSDKSAGLGQGDDGSLSGRRRDLTWKTVEAVGGRWVGDGFPPRASDHGATGTSRQRQQRPP